MRGYNPALRLQNRVLYQGFVLGFANPGGDHSRSIVDGHFMLGRVEIGVIEGSFGDPGFEVI